MIKIFFTKKVLLIAAVFSTTYLFGQKNSVPDYTNRIMVRTNDYIIEGTARKKDIAASLVCEDCFYFWYKGSAIHRTQGAFEGRLLYGPFSEFYPNMDLATKGQFKNGLKIGKWQNWYSSGALKEVTNWAKGKLNGPFQELNEQGGITKKGNYKKGLLHGWLFVYTANDSVTKQKYVRGIPLPAKSKGTKGVTKPKQLESPPTELQTIPADEPTIIR